MSARENEISPYPSIDVASGGPARQRVNSFAVIIAWRAIFVIFVVFVVFSGVPSCGETPRRPVSLNLDVRPILMTSCAFGNTCHGSPSCAGHVQLGPNSDLDAAALVQGLVNEPSVISPSVMRVVPGDSSASLLIRKLSGDFTGLACGPQACGARMPFGGPPLAATLIDTLRRWVDEGALTN